MSVESVSVHDICIISAGSVSGGADIEVRASMRAPDINSQAERPIRGSLWPQADDDGVACRIEGVCFPKVSTIRFSSIDPVGARKKFIFSGIDKFESLKVGSPKGEVTDGSGSLSGL